MKKNINPAKGMRDFTPREKELRDYIEKLIADTYIKNGFHLIETPVVENIENLMDSEGGENLKLIYKIMKRGEKLVFDKPDINEDDIVELGLRYDLTIPLSRFYCNNIGKLPSVFKSIQIGNVFRAERAQKDRYRCFKQCDIDIIGEPSINAEIELITSTAKALNALEVNDFEIRINDRRILNQVISDMGFTEEESPGICIILDKMDKIGIDGIKKELYGSYDIDKSNALINFLSAGNVNDIDSIDKFNIDSTVKDDMKKIISSVKMFSEGNYDIIYDFTLVRGMGYYTGPIFEIGLKEDNVSIAGGGRYDKMVGNFINRQIPAVGFSIGFERLVNRMDDRNTNDENISKMILLYDKKDDIVKVLKSAETLRGEGYIVSVYKKAKNLKNQLDQLQETGYEKFAFFDTENIMIKDLN